MARPAPPADDGSPARLIATMVGIVGILLLGSLAWSAVGALASALGSAGATLTSSRAPSTLGTAAAATEASGPALATPSPSLAVVVAPASATATPEPATPEPATPTPVVARRDPWILLPQPEPNAHVSPGPITIEARGRGDAPIAAIRLDLDGAALPVSLEHRSETTWRGFATARVNAGQHSVRAVVVDADGRTGSYRWTFGAGP